jgi:alpha-tubulin suppressor-like RCC1 family protein
MTVVTALLAAGVGPGCNSSSNGPPPAADASCTPADASVSALLSVDAGSPACQACIRNTCTAAVNTCSMDCECNTTAVSALGCIEGLGSSASLGALASCVQELTGSTNTDLADLGGCLTSCESACAAAAADGCAPVDATATSYLDTDAGACGACLQARCTTAVAQCTGDCTCNAAVVTALQCVDGLGASTSIGSATTCVAPVLNAVDPDVLAVGQCLVESCAATCGVQASDAGMDATAPGEAGAVVSDAGTEAAAPDGATAMADATAPGEAGAGDATAPPDGATPMPDAMAAGEAGADADIVPIAISAALATNCALLSNGAVACWGEGQDGELGNGKSGQSSTPVLVSGLSGPDSGLSGATAIVGTQGNGGEGCSCALLSGGTAACWGVTPNTGSSVTPGAVSGISGATAISTGQSFLCALFPSGSVECLGGGIEDEGVLGNGSTIGTQTPQAVTGLSSATAISSGLSFTCALLSAGTVECWGDASYGQLGNGTIETSTPVYSTTPVAVTGLSGATAISSGYWHACALVSGGGAECWGYNVYGELGAVTSGDSSATAVTVSGLSGAIAISAGAVHTCALLSTGTVECWGGNTYGQLGNEGGESSTPVAVAGLSGVIAIAAGYYSTCALLSGGSIECWGENANGELGDGTTVSSSTPTTVTPTW